MKSNFTNFYLKLSLYLIVFVGFSAKAALAQGFAGGRTYIVNGQIDQVLPVDTFVNLMGTGNTGAINFLNNNGVDVTQPIGTITILLDAGYSGIEPTGVQVGRANGSGYPNMSSSRPVVLKPNVGLNFVITSSTAIAANGSLFRVFGSTDFTVDGSGTTGQRNITFSMGALSSGTTCKVVDIIPAVSTFSNRVRNITIRNCNIIGNSTTSANNTYAGIYFGGTSSTPSAATLGTNYNINYVNNNIMAVQNGIYHRGFATNTTAFPSQDTGVNVLNNIIGGYVNPINSALQASIGSLSSNLAGVYLHTVSNSTISGNIIRNTIALNFGSVNAGFAGIRLDAAGATVALDSNIRITKNQIYNLFTNAAGQSVSGIRISLGNHITPRRLLVANNSISRIFSVNGGSNILSASTAGYTAGITIENQTANLGLELYFNSVNLKGDTMASGSVSTCLFVGSLTTGGIISLNNSFVNNFGSTLNNTTGYQNYAVIAAANNINPFTYSNFNNYYSNTFGPGYAFVAGIIRNNTLRNIPSIKNYRIYSLSDTNSLAVIAPTSNDTVWNIPAGFPNRTSNRGYALNTLNQFSAYVNSIVVNKVIDDLYGNIRTGFGRFTSIGCHHWNGDSNEINIGLLGGNTYPINGFSVPPTASNPTSGSFRDLSEAVTYLNSYGISGNQNNVVLEIRGTYPRENTFIPAIIDYPGADQSLNVVIRPAVGVVDTIWAPNRAIPNNASILTINGAKNVIIDGLASGSNEFRNLTFMFRSLSNNPISRVIGITPSDEPSQNITIRNVNIVGNTTNTAINTLAGIYYSFPFLTTATPGQNDTLRSLNNRNINIVNNLIQGVRNGIMVRGSGANPTGDPVFAGTIAPAVTNRVQNLKIIGNIIGGNIAPGGTLPTTYIGGANNQSGIFVMGVEAAIIDSNVVRNCLPTSTISQGFKGIEVAETSIRFPNFDVSVTKNFIYNLTTINGQGNTGIRAQFTAVPFTSNGVTVSARGYLFANNHISKIIGIGAGTPISVANPTGILIDASVPFTLPNLVTMVNNTINMSGNNFLSTNGGIAALYMGSNIRGGISSINNIFGVTANRNTTGNMYSVITLAPTSPYAQNPVFLIAASDFNSYFVSGNNPNPLNNILMATPSSTAIPVITARTNINTLRLFTGTNTDLSSFNFPTQFISDSLPDLLTVTSGSRYSSGSSNSLVLTDIYGVSRASGPQLGAARITNQNAPLQPNGVYQINGTDNYPVLGSPSTGSFRTLRSAVNYLNAFGTGLSFAGVQPAKLVISAGYVGETDTFTSPITVFDFPSANAAVPVIVTVAAGRQDTIRFTNVLVAPPANTSLIRFNSSSFFGFDGSNNGTITRDLTIMMPSNMTSPTYKIIDIVGGQSSIFATTLSTSSNFVNNCNLIGNSTTFSNNTFSAIYMGGLTATPSNSAGAGLNNNNAFINNFIGGCQYGIYLRGNGIRGQGDNNTNITNNTIGGNTAPGGSTPTNYFGGINNAAGIFCVGQYRATIKGNRIQNNIQSFSNPRGIELGVIPGSNTILDSANIIDGNIINNIVSTSSGSAAYGLYINFGSDNGNITNSTRIYNNMISGIAAPGSTTLMNGVYGIAIDAATNFTDPNITIHFNSVNLGTANTLTAGRSACLAIAPNFPLNGTSLFLGSGFKMTNNLFTNNLGGTSTSTGIRASAVQFGSVANSFSQSENNNYFCNATFATKAQFVNNASGVTPNLLNGWDSINRFTGGDLYSTNLTIPFTSDNNLFIPALTNSVIYGAGIPVFGINQDVISNTRNGLSPTMGAHEYVGGVNIDSVLPRIIPANATVCLSTALPTIRFIIAEKNFVSTFLTYRVNGGSSTNITGIVSVNSQGFPEVTFTIPSTVITTGGLIEYKVSATEISTNIGTYPVDGSWAVLPTGIAQFPYTMNFENGLQGWNAQTLTLGAAWDINAFGSPANPSQATESGIKCALFPSSTLPVGASARLTSPCFNLSAAQRPILRFRFSQSNAVSNKRDSLIVRVLTNGFTGPDIKVALRPNLSTPFADWFTFETCLTEYRTPGNVYSFQFDAYSTGGGQNILIDSIQVIDDFQTQTITSAPTVICNIGQPVTISVPNTDTRYAYRAIQRDLNGNFISILDSVMGNGGTINFGFANRQVDTLFYAVSAINYGSGTYQPPFSVNQPNFCSNDLPGGLRSVIIHRFTRPLTSLGGYVQPDIFTPNAFKGAANDGDQFKPDAVKFGNLLTYDILSPNSYYTNASYGTNWTILNTSVRTFAGNTLATNWAFTPPSGGNNAKVTFTPTAAEGDTLFLLSTTIRFIGTNCDTTINRFIKVANPIAYGFITGPRADTACTGTPLNFLINQGTLAGVTTAWNFNDGSPIVTFGNYAKTYSTPGLYRALLTVTSSLGISDTVSRLIRVIGSPNANYNVSSVAIVCQNDSTVFSATNTAPGLTHIWTFPGNVSRIIPVTNFKFNKADTNYAVTLRVTDPVSGCFGLNTRIFPSYARPVAKFTVASHCQGQDLPYTDSSSISNGDRLGWYWSFSTGEQRQSNSFQIKFENPGNVRVSLRLTSAAGCQDTLSKLVTVYETPKPNFIFNAACTNDSTSFTNQTVFSAGIQNAAYTWDFGDNSGADLRQDPRHRYLNNNSGDPFVVKLIAENRLFGCKDSVSRDVVVKTAPIAVAELDGAIKTGVNSYKVCEGNLVNFNSKSFSSSGASITCGWAFGDGNQSGACNTANIYANQGTFVWTISATADGCQDTKSGSIVVVPKPVITFSNQGFAIPPSRFTVNNRQVLTPSDLPSDGNSYTWNLGDADSTTTNQRIPDFTYNKKGTFTVRMQVTTVDGCVVNFSDTVKVDVGVSVGEELASKFNLVAYPNPFANNTVISLDLLKTEDVSITVIDVLGRVISTNTYNKVSTGKHEFELASNNFNAAGTYFVKVKIGDDLIVKSIIKQ